MSAPVGSIESLVQGLFKSTQPRTFQKVRRNSPHVGEREERLWRQFNLFEKDDHNAIMRAAEKIERETKRPGKRNGAIGYIGMSVLRYLLRLRNRVTGRLDPSLARIADDTGHSRSAVHAALVRLKDVGFIDWMRRSVPVQDPEPGGQYVKQTSSAFTFPLRGRVEKIVCALRRKLTRAQASAASEADRRAKSEAMTTEQNIALIADPGLRAPLERMRSFYRSENLPAGLNNGPCKV